MTKDEIMEKAKLIANQICAGEKTPYEGAYEIWDLTLTHKGEHFHDLDPFIYAASEWPDRPKDRPFFDNEIMKISKLLVAGESIL